MPEIKFANGSVVFFNEKKKLGMIKATNDSVFWFHRDAIVNGGKPEEGVTVAFSYKEIDDPMPLRGVERQVKILTVDIVK